MPKLSLPQVTLCCVDTTGRIPTTLQAIRLCMEQVDFGDAVLLTTPDALLGHQVPEGLRIALIEPITSIEAYSQFMLKSLSPHVTTSHCLVVQWDGYITNASQWTDEFLQVDYIGAPWPDAAPDQAVGNGGFSLRSKKLLLALESDAFVVQHPEDACICKQHRQALEAQGIQFGTLALARRFSVESGDFHGDTFGFHGPHHLPVVLGPNAMLGFIQSFTPEKLLHSNLFDMLLRELTHSAARNPEFQPALIALKDAIRHAVSRYKSSATESEYSLVICKALVRYGQFEAAQMLLAYRFEAEGMKWANVKLWLRLHIFRFMQGVGLRR